MKSMWFTSIAILFAISVNANPDDYTSEEGWKVDSDGWAIEDYDSHLTHEA